MYFIGVFITLPDLYFISFSPITWDPGTSVFIFSPISLLFLTSIIMSLDLLLLLKLVLLSFKCLVVFLNLLPYRSLMIPQFFTFFKYYINLLHLVFLPQNCIINLILANFSFTCFIIVCFLIFLLSLYLSFDIYMNFRI